jgi:hypothetical protein
VAWMRIPIAWFVSISQRVAVLRLLRMNKLRQSCTASTTALEKG